MRLLAHVHVRDSDGVVQVFGPGDTVPAWAQEQITNPKAFEDDSEAVEKPRARRRTK